jgi:formamidopyrimidine-DNA glycosylase
MPELPEVEVTRQGLVPHIVGRSIASIHAGKKNLRLPIPGKNLQKLACGSMVNAIGRRAKYLVFFLDKAAMIIHLGMSGKIGIFPSGSPPALHDHLVFHFHDGMEMRYNDARRFGFITLLTPEDIQKRDPFAQIGPEPLPLPRLQGISGAQFSDWQKTFADSHHQLTPSYLKKKAGKRLQPIKNFLMDSHVVAGIGNIYANEILFAAALLPTTAVGSVSRASWEKIHTAIPQILSRAIACGGTTIRDFVSSSGEQGYFQVELKVYGREGDPCRSCGTPITKSIIAGRATYFCLHCQR